MIKPYHDYCSKIYAGRKNGDWKINDRIVQIKNNLTKINLLNGCDKKITIKQIEEHLEELMNINNYTKLEAAEQYKKETHEMLEEKQEYAKR